MLRPHPGLNASNDHLHHTLLLIRHCRHLFENNARDPLDAGSAVAARRRFSHLQYTAALPRHVVSGAEGSHLAAAAAAEGLVEEPDPLFAVRCRRLNRNLAMCESTLEQQLVLAQQLHRVARQLLQMLNWVWEFFPDSIAHSFHVHHVGDLRYQIHVGHLLIVVCRCYPNGGQPLHCGFRRAP
jgi:hypothetical protein